MKKSMAFLLAALLAAVLCSTGTLALAQGKKPLAIPPRDDGIPYGRPARDVPDCRLSGLTVGLDPGHQLKANKGKEPLAPGSRVKKQKVSSGTQGRYTRVPEYEVNLQVALKLKSILESEGARVVMTRTTHAVDISNMERALLFNSEKVDLGIRLHCNGSTKKSIYGAFVLIPYQTDHAAECMNAARCVLDEYIKATGTKDLGITKRSDQTGFNWCTQTIINIEMGHMTNKAEDYNLTCHEYQIRMAVGIFNGICRYFGR